MGGVTVCVAVNFKCITKYAIDSIQSLSSIMVREYVI